MLQLAAMHIISVIKNDIPVFNITGDNLNYDEWKQSWFPSFSTLAIISISDPRRLPVTIAVQLRLEDSNVCLTDAENEKVKNGFVNYHTCMRCEVWLSFVQ